MINLIAEIAGGHLGQVDKAIELVTLAHESNANSVKFQFYKAKELCDPTHADYKLFQSLEFSMSDWKIIKQKIKDFNLNFYADVFGFESFEEAEALGVEGYKMHSADLENLELIERVVKTGKTLFLGVGGRKRTEIYKTLKFVRSKSEALNIVLMPGHQLFPTPVFEHELTELLWFAEVYKDFNVQVGCADHIDGSDEMAVIWPVSAIGAGSRYVEKHLTIDRSLKLEDYESALDPANFKRLATYLRSLETSIKGYPFWSAGRESYRKKAIKVPMAMKPIDSRSNCTNQNINLLRASTFSEPLPVDLWKGREAKRKIEAYEVLNGKNVASKVGILVNARSASQRLPRKALMKIAGKETILHLLERVKNSKECTDIVFCTTTRSDDDELAKLVSQNGFKVFRGPDEQVAERLYLAAKENHFDHIVRVTGDDLLRDVDLIDLAIKSHLEKNADYTDIQGVVYGCSSEIISFRALETIVERASNSLNTEYLSWYLDDSSAFVQNVYMAPKEYLRDYRLTLDTLEDFKVFEAIFKQFYQTGKTISLTDTLIYLDQHPEITSINERIKPKLSRTELDLSLRI